MELLFASANPHKISELRKILPGHIRLLSLIDLQHLKELEETQSTFEGNARQKSTFIHKKYGKNCFADDSGLEVEVLNGAPGVYSARFAGEEKNDANNVNKLLQVLEGEANRKANFRTVICLMRNGEAFFFEGVVYGQIAMENRGKSGFGYDPIFIPDGFDKTFAEMASEEKNSISHRALAVGKLVDFLTKIN
ncbi:MAG: non-canonical purine NTP pyrophosphatase, RdgB/HAM1 family [Flavobacteriales bacterium CG_4_9_14_3_um_filter_40_17]|nr:MAG: non-canonical purine NTP pyrophosphatase, RdgB/HAM1 family [Flavobacteriales bacterium CG_4_9_14_3_um_filter_40_17]